MKTRAIFGIVVVMHFLAIGGIVLMQGCESNKVLLGDDPAPPPVMPPVAAPKYDPVSLPTHVRTPWTGADKVYVVKKGDSLSRIASRHSVSVAELVAFNGLKNKNVIRIGQRLSIPVAGSAKSTPKRSKPAPRKHAKLPAGTSGAYVVVPGDCLSVIAANFNVSSKAIMSANGMTSDKVIVGQKLVIPGVKVDPKKVVSASMKDKPPVNVSDKVDDKVEAKEPEVVAEPVTEPASSGAKTAVITDTHEVQAGDTLRKISMQWLVGEEKIRQFNNIPAGQDVKVGDKLLIPLSD